MRTPRPILAFVAVAICASGYLAPWALGMWTSGADIVGMNVEPEPEREVRLLFIPPQLEEEPEPQVEIVAVDAPSEPGPELLVATTEPSPLTIEAVLIDSVAPPEAPRLVVERKRRVSRSPRKARPCEPDRDDIDEVAETAFRIEDRLVYFYANHVPEANKLAATWWNEDEDGEHYGFKVGRMKCGSVLHQAGFKNGDIIVAVNGLTIRSYADGVGAYMRLRAKRVLWVDVLRRGEPIRLDFVLVDEGMAEADFDTEDPLFDPTALVERELELDELPWLERRLEKGKDRRDERRWGRERG